MVGAGFVGTATREALLRMPGVESRVVSRRGDPEVGRASVDIGRAATLVGMFDGADAVVLAASDVGATPERCWRTNADGAANTVAAARRAGVPRVVYVSTAGVYGDQPAHEARVGDLALRPRSPASRSRSVAERHVLDGGGVVARPHWVHGEGDRWFRPGLTRVARRLGACLRDRDPLVSVIAVQTLGEVVAGLALAEDDAVAPGSVWHANHPTPVGVNALLRAGHAPAARSAPVSIDEARRRAAADPEAGRLLEMLLEDRWYDSRPVWRAVGLDPGGTPGPDWCDDGTGPGAGHGDAPAG